jgi:hypothetical protein
LPGADITLQRPLAGRFFKWLAPEVVTITRQRDESWTGFMEHVRPDSLVLILPEGRMKRPGGLDKQGQPMTVRGGVADILEKIESGQMLIVYSGGLHHIHTPGHRWPRLFRRAHAALEILSIAEYRGACGVERGHEAFRAAVIADLEARRDRICPELEAQGKNE